MIGNKTGLVFPGQGSQSIGMGKDLFEFYPEARALFEKADSILGFSLSKICFEGPEEELKKTAVTQPALLTASVAAFTMLNRNGFSYQGVSGHSLGAYSALVAAGALSFEDAVRLVRRRGELMEAAGQGKGTMAAVLGLNEEKVQQACREASHLGIVEPANINCPGQIVISGEKPAVLEACAKAKTLGAKRAMELAVSGPFHSRLMEPAAKFYRDDLQKVEFSKPKVSYYSDIDAVILEEPGSIRESLVRQLTSPVQWIKAIEAMTGDGINRFIEVGPGLVLGGLIRKIIPGAAVQGAGNKAAIQALGGGA